MHYSSIEALPQSVRSILPVEAQKLFLRVVNPALAHYDGDEPKAQAIAWYGLSNAGWAKGADGTFVMTKRAAFTVAKGGRTWSARLPVQKLDEAKRIAFGWASTVVDEGGRIIIDHQSEIIPVEELEQAAYAYVKGSGNSGHMHRELGVGRNIESVVMTPEKRVAMGLPGDGPTGWWVGFHVFDQAVWKRVASGELPEFSIGGSAVPQLLGDGKTSVLRKLAIHEVSFVDAGAGIHVPVAMIKAHGATKGKPMSEAKPVEKQVDLDDLVGTFTPEQKDSLAQFFESEFGLSADMIAGIINAPDPDAAQDAADPTMTTAPIAASASPPIPPASAAKLPAKKVLVEGVNKALAAQLEDERSKRVDLEKRLEMIEEERSFETYVGKARALEYLPGVKLEALAKAMRAIDKSLPKEIAAELHRVMKNANDVIARSNVFAELGSVGSGGGGDDTEAKVSSLAKARAKKEGVTSEKAYSLILDEQPDLYTEMDRENQERRRNAR